MNELNLIIVMFVYFHICWIEVKGVDELNIILKNKQKTG